MELTREEKESFGKSRSTGDRPPNLRHGKYLLMMDRWFLHRGYRNVLSDVHNFIVVKGDQVTVMEGDRARTDLPNEAWTRSGATFKWDGKSMEMARINSTRFTLAMLGLNDAEISEAEKIEAWERLTNEDPKKFNGEKNPESGEVIPSTNPTRGMLIACETTPVLTKESKQWIVSLNFMHVAPPGYGENTYAMAAKRWAEYEARIKAGA